MLARRLPGPPPGQTPHRRYRTDRITKDASLSDLRAEIERLLAAALATQERHDAELARNDQRHITETERRDQLHVDEMQRRDELHVDEMQRRDDVHAHEMDLIRAALETRDIIGQAKGVIMAAMSCSPDEAFSLLMKQSRHENRKLVAVAAEIAQRAANRPPSPVAPD